MSWTWAISLVLCGAFVLAAQILGIGRSTGEQLFWDDFSRPSDKWQDMRVWGFGVWQVRDGTFVSYDEAAPEQTIYATAPRFAHALVNRDYTLQFRYRPVAGSYYLFSVNVRQHGWDCYKFEVDLTGTVRIVKARLGQEPEVLATSTAGAVQFGQWQWVRLDVRGESPLLLRAKVWQGAYRDEAPLYDAVARDPLPLPPSQLSISVNMVQQGGAHTALDDFAVLAGVKASPVWRWAKVRGTGKARRHFAQGKLWAAEQALKTQLAQDKATWAGYNNLALIAAEKGDFVGALQMLQKAHALAPEKEVVGRNLAWVWRSFADDGLLKSPRNGQSGLIVKADRQVYFGGESGRLNVWALGRAYGGPAGEKLRVSIQDSSSQTVWEAASCQVPDSGAWACIPIEFSPQTIADGRYMVVASAGKARATFAFEVVSNAFRNLHEAVAALRERVAAGRQAGATVHANDWANLEVLLLPVERALAQAGLPGQLISSEVKAAATLAQARVALAALEAGQNPWAHAVGTFLRGYYSEVDGSVQGYALHVPAGYDGQRPYPLVVNLHGYDPSFSDWRDNPFLPGFIPEATAGGRYILVNPFGRGNTMYQDLGEQDVLTVLAEVQRLYRIDADRIYLTGGSMGGGGTWYVGLRHPDLFAALAPVMGPTDYGFWLGLDSASTSRLRRFLVAKRSPLSYAENGGNLALWCAHGAKDNIVPVDQSRVMVGRLRQLGYPIVYTEYPDAAHGGFPPQMERDKYDWFAEQVRTPWPPHVVYKTGDLDHPGSYWVQIERFQDLLGFASLDAKVEGPRRIVVCTDNVRRFGLEVPPALRLPSSPLEVVVDDELCYQGSVPTSGALRFERSAEGRWAHCPSSLAAPAGKRPGLSGPISSAFNGPFLLVYGTVGRQQENEAAKAEAEAFAEQWRRWQHAPCRLKSDREVTTADIENFHLVLLGGPQCNLLTERVNGELPIQFRRGAVQVGSKTFRGPGVGAAFVYPNPLNPDRYVAVFGGVSWRGTCGVLMRIGTEFDYVIFDEKTVGRHAVQGAITVDGTPLLCGFFDQEWQLSERYQWSADERVRAEIVPFTVPELVSPNEGSDTCYLSDLVPAQVEQWTRLPAYDRTYWGTALRGGRMPAKGLGVYPNSRLRYGLDGSWRFFSATLCADLRPEAEGKPLGSPEEKVQFAVYGDGEELLVSRLMGAASEPQEVRVPIFGVRRLDLVVGTQAWLPGSAVAASWVNARLEGR